MTLGPDNHAAVHHLVGAYVLGGLDSREREQFEQHLVMCRLCADELSSLHGLSGLLGAVPLEDVLAIGAARQPDVAGALDGAGGGVGPLMAKLASRRRKSRWRATALMSGAAAACLAIGFLAGTAGTSPDSPEVSYVAGAGSGPQVRLGLVKKAWGTELALSGNGLPVKGILSLWVEDRSGSIDRAASWSATPRGQAEVVGATPVSVEQLARAEIRDSSGKTIAVLAPAAKN